MSRDTLQYKGYVGIVRYDDDDEVFHGEVVNIPDLVTYHGKSVAELRKSFRESIDFYIEACLSVGQEPNKPFSGRLSLRMKPSTHRALSALASRKGRSLNGLVSGILDRAARKIDPGLRIAPSAAEPPPSAPKKKAARPRRARKVDA